MRVLRPGELRDASDGERRYVELHVLWEVTHPAPLIELARSYSIASHGYDALEKHADDEDELLEQAVWQTVVASAPHMANWDSFPMADMLHLVFAFPAGEDEDVIERVRPEAPTVNEPKRAGRRWSRTLLPEIEFCPYDHRKLSAGRSHGWLLYIGKRQTNYMSSFAVIGKHYAEDLRAHREHKRFLEFTIYPRKIRGRMDRPVRQPQLPPAPASPAPIHALVDNRHRPGLGLGAGRVHDRTAHQPLLHALHPAALLAEPPVVANPGAETVDGRR